MVNIFNKDISDYINAHKESVLEFLNRPKQKSKFKNILSWIDTIWEGQHTFEYILTASPIQLADLKAIFERNKTKRSMISDVLYLKTLYSYFSSTQSLLIDSTGKKYDGFVLFEKLGVTVCPYCNRNFIYNIPKDTRRTGELDHFYDKNKYPFFAMSFYNLVPSCKVCNHIKSFNGKDLINPYDTTKKLSQCFKFSANIKGVDYLSNLDELSIDTIFNDKCIENNIEIFNIEKLYGKHKDIVQEIFKKKYFYSEDYIEQLTKDFQGTLFKNREELIGLLLSNFISEDELGKRPLAKLTKDIAEDIGF